MSEQELTRQPDVRDEPDMERSAMSAEEIDQQEASELPDRDAMSLVNLNAAVPVNAAIAANVLSDGSHAAAGALQNTPITQSQ